MRKAAAMADGEPPDQKTPDRQESPDKKVWNRIGAFRRPWRLVMPKFAALASEADASPPADAIPHSISAFASIASA